MSDWRPAGWKSLAATPESARQRVCFCDRCVADGQHEPMCAVHEEPAEPCDCPKGGER
jgi:hypothetical protein